MPISLAVHQNPELPPLAWIAHLNMAQGTVTASVGGKVEAGRQGLVEGIWVGEFGEMGFDRSRHFFGTGLRVRGEAVLLVSSSAVTDRVYLAEGDGITQASNSLPLLLKVLGARLDPNRSHWAHSSAIGAGLSAQPVWLDDIDGPGKWRVFVAGTLAVRKGVTPEFTPHGEVRSFRDYEDYRTAIETEIDLLFQNLHDSERRHRITSFTTASRGYDSACVSALLSNRSISGCFCKARSNSLRSILAPGDDDGTEIAIRLGLQPLALGTPTAEEEVLFRAPSCYPPALAFASAMRHLPSVTALFTGYYGDSVWGLEPVAHPTDIRCPAPTGVSLAEPRLTAGVIHVPLPFLFGRSLESLRAISRSAEMKPWLLGNGYDRPIPRRILEEAGIPRTAFGTTKRAIVSTRLLPLTGDARRSFLRWCDENASVPSSQVWVHEALNRYSYPFRAALRRLLARSRASPVTFMPAIDTRSLMMSWANDHAVASLRTAGAHTNIDQRV